MSTVVIKIGGSLITDKRRPFTLNERALEEVAEGIASIRDGARRIVIVHGGGSFGHYAVQQSRGDTRKLLTDVTYWMTFLNHKVVHALIQHDVSAVGLPTWLVARGSKEGLIVETGLVAKLLEVGVVPVTHGGLINTDEGFKILSGDTLASKLAVKLPASALIFLMDVEGVYTEDPRVNPSATLLTVLRRSDLDRIRGGSSGVDVTGGLMLKLNEAIHAAERGVNVALGSVKALRSIVEGVEGRYTRVIP